MRFVDVKAILVVSSILLLLIALYCILIKNRALKLLDSKLRDSEALFRAVFEKAPIGIAVVENYNHLSNINAMFEKILCRKKDELISINWVELTHPDDLDEDLEQFSNFKAGKIDGYSMEKRYIKPDGSYIWVHMAVAGLQKNGKNYQNHLCIIQDINKRKLAEKALNESERSKSVLLSHLPGMAYRCSYDRDWTMQFISQGCFELTGYKPESLLYNKELSYNELIVPEYRDILWSEWDRVLALKTPFRYEYEIIASSGQRKWVLEMGQGICDETGNVEALEGIVIDITEEKERKAQIKYIIDHDYITGLYNRRYYEEALDIELLSHPPNWNQ